MNKSEIKILLVDDEKLVANALERNLRDMGYSQTKTASRGEEAIELIQDYNPNLIIMDTDMGGSNMPGYEVCRQIKLDYGVGITVIGMSGREEWKEEWLKAGSDRFLYKSGPDFFRSLDSLIQELFKNGGVEKWTHNQYLFYRKVLKEP